MLDKSHVMLIFPNVRHDELAAGCKTPEGEADRGINRGSVGVMTGITNEMVR